MMIFDFNAIFFERKNMRIFLRYPNKIFSGILILLLTSFCAIFGEDFVQKPIKLSSPNFLSISPSFFTKENVHDLFIFHISMGVGNSPKFFAQDHDSILIESIKNFAFQNGIQLKDVVDLNILKTKSGEYSKVLIPSKPIPLFIVVNSKICETNILEWWQEYLLFNCSAKPQQGITISSPSALIGYTRKDIIYSFGILSNCTILPLFDKLPKSRVIDKEIMTEDGKNIKIHSLDLNGDKIDDIFWYQEPITELSAYERYYFNIDGKWIPLWYEIVEDCV